MHVNTMCHHANSCNRMFLSKISSLLANVITGVDPDASLLPAIYNGVQLYSRHVDALSISHCDKWKGDNRLSGILSFHRPQCRRYHKVVKVFSCMRSLEYDEHHDEMMIRNRWENWSQSFGFKRIAQPQTTSTKPCNERLFIHELMLSTTASCPIIGIKIVNIRSM